MTSKKFRWDKDVGVYEVGGSDAPESVYLGNNAWSTGLVSESVGCHSSQVAQFREDIANAKINADVRPDGAIVFYSRKARNDYMRLRGLCDRDAGYGDRAPTQY